jgi:hypothetical protein
MRRRWLVVGVCAAGVLGIRMWAAHPAKAAGITHVAALVSDNPNANGDDAQYRYLQSQPRHWRQCMIRN